MAQEEIIFKVGVDTGDSVQDVNKVGDAIEEVGKDAKKADGSFVNLRKELKQLTIQLQNLDPASKEFETVARRAGQIKEQMRGVADAINDADPEKFGGKFQRTAEGIAGAFSAVTGAQALFGQQSEEIEKQMLKVQGAIALTQGISAMKELKNDATDLAMSIKGTVVNAFKSLTTAEMINATETGSLTLLQKGYAIAVGTSTGAMKAFRIALAATGIGLLVVALGFLVEKMISYMSSTDDATKAQDRLTASTKRFNAERERMNKKLNDSIEFEKNYAKAVGASEEKIYEIEKQGFKKREAQRESDYWANLQRISTLREKKKNALNAENMDLVKSINEEITNIKTKNNELIDLKYQLQREEKVLTAQHNTDLKNEQNDANKEALAKQKEASQKSKEQREKDAQEQFDLRRKIKDLFIANIVDVNKREKEELLERQKREREDLKTQYQDKEQYGQLEKELKIKQGNERKELEKKQGEESRQILLENQNKVLDDQKAILEAEIIKNAENFALKQQRQLELENTDFEQKKLNAKGNKAQLELIEAQHAANIKAINKEATDYQKQLDKELADAKNFLVEQTSNMFGQLASSAKQGSAIQKAFAVTQLTIDTAKSISATIAGATAAASAGGPAAPFLLAGYIAQGVATVTSAMNTAKKLLNAPLPNVAPPTTQRPNETVQTQQGTQQSIQAQSTYKVVVVDSDITKMQDKTKKVNAISTI